MASFLAASNALSSQLDITAAIHAQNAPCTTRIVRAMDTNTLRQQGTDKLLVNIRAVKQSSKAIT